MKKERLERTFCWKITAELKGFKYRVMQMEKEKIFGLAYQIDSVVRIYEALMEMSRELGEEQLQSCMYLPGLLDFLYDRWLQSPEAQGKDLEQFIHEFMSAGNLTAA